MLELRDIKKSYKVGDSSQQVLKGINVNFRKTEFVSILGKSGSGKTTLLNIIGGLDKYDSGELIIDGIQTQKYTDRDWDSYRNHRVGFVFQSYNLIMHQSVYSNVEIALTLSGVSKKERKEKVIEVLTKVGLKDHIYKKPNQLSGGQMQRVAIARALVNNPDIILADEPTGALDSNTSIQIMDLLKEISKDKLVIMVTHNPDLAKTYSTRIIELKDGEIINDSDHYNEVESKTENAKAQKTSMSFITSLMLSFNNLLTKKGRTFLTAFAGSVGIIGIALILALSNGLSQMISKVEKESTSDYPITIEKNSTDIFAILSNIQFDSSTKNVSYGDKLQSKDDLVSTNSSFELSAIKSNNLIEFKKFIDNNEELKKYYSDIKYNYDLELQVYSNDYKKVSPSDLTVDISKNIFKEIDNNVISNNNNKLVAGHYPKNMNEAVLVLNNTNEIPDSLLYALNIKDRNNLSRDFEKVIENPKYKVETTTYNYDDFLNKSYKIILNTDYYENVNGVYIDYSNNYDYLKSKVDGGIDLKIVGVIKTDSYDEIYVGYSHDLTLKVIEEISKTDIYNKQIVSKNTNILTGKTFDNIKNTYDEICKKLGIFEINNPTSINIYPNNYNAKESIIKIIEEYNEDKKKNNQNDLVISYSDTMKNIFGGISNIVNIISYVLIGFVAISLIVSSIMIGIITYISVLERTKEIGILRAIGASKKDIKRVFISETIIEGLIAGILGIVITLLLSIPINAIVGLLAKVEGICSLPFLSAIILILLSIVLNEIAGSMPSKIAAKKDPVQSLRSE